MSALSSTSTTEGIDLSTDPSRAELASAVDDLVDFVQSFASTQGDLRERIRILESEKEELRTENDALRTRVEGLEEENEELHDRVEDLEEETEQLRADLSESRSLQRDLGENVAELSVKVSDLIDSDGSYAPSPEQQLRGKIETPLGKITALSAGQSYEHLTANQRRARSLIHDIEEVTNNTPAGREIKSSDLRRYLAGQMNGKVHPQTLSRVIEFLDDFGKEGVKIRWKGNERSIFFPEDVAERLAGIARSDVTLSVIGDWEVV